MAARLKLPQELDKQLHQKVEELMAVTECWLWVAYVPLHTTRSNMKKLLAGDEKKELFEAIDPFKNYCVPLIVPITLTN